MSEELKQFLPLFILFVFAAGFAVSAVFIPRLIGKKRTYQRSKDMPYECGMLPEASPHMQFSVKFYLVAMLFILFDLEIIFILGWATVFGDLSKPLGLGGIGAIAFWGMVIFVGMLELGHFYIYKQGALDWAPKHKKHKVASHV